MQQIEITKGINGYPKDLHCGYVGFDTFEEAVRFAKENNGRVVDLRLKKGWQFWESLGCETKPYTLTAETFGDDFSTVDNVEDWENDCRELLSGLIDRHAPLEDLKETITAMAQTAEMIELLDDNRQVLLYHGKYYEIIDKETMSYFEDVWRHEIGVEL